jgi:succinate dehydrogenase / fumarate reductase cytochrome b subunit
MKTKRATVDGTEPYSSVLIKVGMALSGLGVAVWLTLHMAGHLLWLAGPELMNQYGKSLHGSGILWPVRLLLVGGFAVHVAAALLTTRRGLAARTVRYRVSRPQASTFSSRAMRWTGLALLSFIPYHVATVYGAGRPALVDGGFHENLSSLLLRPADALLLSAAAGVVALHLAHGLASACMSLGLVAPRYERRLRGTLMAWVCLVSVGFLLPPAGAWLVRLWG